MSKTGSTSLLTARPTEDKDLDTDCSSEYHTVVDADEGIASICEVRIQTGSGTLRNNASEAEKI